ncbi:MAG: aromatic ring-hydroxylating dioxygenase subunit alpha [Burkholderiaceae bacterium]|jgi:nitrite reductase/ring-hydroxylating ferredoxin subunit|nr:aromatic ring-hydroxylating dioxygenase subunit alpha [Burkholderiaceae bacterium]
MSVTTRDSTGNAYNLPAPSYRSDLTEVGRGTPMGELLRRYWHPVGLASHAADTPREVQILGEDLVLFRDQRGRPGLVHARCCHRGTTLYYGRVEDEGIRCCYHGWLFDVQGRCLEQPCEPGGGKARDRIRQPWYPVKEQYGLIFAYMGPPERMPTLPRYECLEVMDEGEFLDVDDTSIGTGGGAIAPCNWLQHYENVVDPFHVPILHGTFSGTQFTPTMNVMPQVVFETTPYGVKVVSTRTTPSGETFHRVTEVCLPTLRVVPSPFVGRLGRVESIGWTVPIDDTHYRIYTAGRVVEKGTMLPLGKDAAKMKPWEDMTPEERRARPTDWEAQVGQGPITLHSEEHMATSDRGIVMLRRLLEREVKAVAEGRDPVGVSFDPDAPPIMFEAGQHLVAQ